MGATCFIAEGTRGWQNYRVKALHCQLPGASPLPPPGFTTPRLDVEIGHGQGIVLDELAARLDYIAHQPREYLISLAEIADLHLQQRARFLVEGCLPQLLGVHFAQALVALHGDALASRVIDRIEQRARAIHRRFVVLAAQPCRQAIDLIQVRLALVEPARLEW